MKVTVVIPCYNAADKVGRCISSLRKIEISDDEYEVIFVDDRSTDNTFDIVSTACRAQKNWRAIALSENSGSPSRPRNIGVKEAAGDYIFFLDCDDEILPDTLSTYIQHAERTEADIVRGYLLADDGKVRKSMNRIEGWSMSWSYKDRVNALFSKQSTVAVSFIKKKVILDNGIEWNERIKMGEDTMFLADVISHSKNIEYIDHPTFVYNKSTSLNGSSTQVYGDRELNNHIEVWEYTDRSLSASGVSYFEVRLFTALRVAIESLIYKNKFDISDHTVKRFSVFINQNWSIISKYKYHDKYMKILISIKRNDYRSFLSLCRPNLLISGHDLKFILPVIPYIENYFEIRLEKWSSHNIDESAIGTSKKNLEWADFIWCEWLLGNAVWYAANKKSNQRLIVRMHRFELGRNFGEELDTGNIDAVITVSVHFFERLLERFPNIPRTKVRLLPNFVEVDDYQRNLDEDKIFNLGVIGILPARKGLEVALAVFAKLYKIDPRYRLEIFGKQPEELPWIARDGQEMAYFERCREYIDNQGISDVVSFNGHADIKTALAEKKVGFVLSTSERVREFPGFESFHLAIADGFAAGGIGLLLDWCGSEYIWPEEYIFQTVDDMVDHILSYRENFQHFVDASERGRTFIQDRYSSALFADGVRSLFREVL